MPAETETTKSEWSLNQLCKLSPELRPELRALPSGVNLNTLEAFVWSGSLSPKTLALPNGALDGTKCKIKWEGYDNGISEPAEVPYCVFPADIGRQPAPENVVGEGRYYYCLRAADDRVIQDPPDTTLTQSYDVDNIPINVRYNMTDVEK